MPYIKTPSGINWFYQINPAHRYKAGDFTVGEVKGQGKVLVFIHGWSFDSSVWKRQISDFSDYKVLTLDLPGHGNSSYKQGIDIIKDLNFVFEKLELRNINLIGHSLGGSLALKFALSYAEVVDNIILIGTNAKFVKSLDYEYGLSESEVNKLRGFLTDNYPDILLVFMRWLFTPLEKTVNFNRQSSLTGFTKQERSQTDFREIWDLVSKRKSWPQKEALSEFLSIIEKGDLRNELNNIDFPTLIISGASDPICPLESAHYLNKQIKSSKIELFENCGHLPFLTHPQRLNSLVRDFLK